MSLIEDCLNHIEEVVHLRAISGIAYPRAQAAVGILRSALHSIQVISGAALWGEPQMKELLDGMTRIQSVATEGKPSKPIEELIAASSLGSPEVVAARASVDPNLVKRVLRRAQELETHPKCPACYQAFKSTDHDPFCSSCVDAGWDLAWVRGYAKAILNRPTHPSPSA